MQAPSCGLKVYCGWKRQVEDMEEFPLKFPVTHPRVWTQCLGTSADNLNESFVTWFNSRTVLPCDWTPLSCKHCGSPLVLIHINIHIRNEVKETSGGNPDVRLGTMKARLA